MSQIVTRVKKELAADNTHYHIKGVCLQDGTYKTRAEVVAGIDRGEDWWTYGGGQVARIKKLAFCPYRTCLLAPYITTAPDHTTENNLDNLPSC